MRKCLTIYFPISLAWVLVCWMARSVSASTSRSTSTATPELPRSNPRKRNGQFPPWNPSPQIGNDGFLTKLYHRVPGDWEADTSPPASSYTCQVPVRVRQIPGDGSCLFHSCSVGLRYAVNQTHWDLQSDIQELYEYSRYLRQQVVECLTTGGRGKLFLQGREKVRAEELVAAAAQQYGLTSQEYCEAMQSDSTWAGGPEIVALCNIIQRPIHVYELHSPENQKEFTFRRMACFGSPRFDHRQPLHILSADSRFPDIEPGQQLPAGNHFLALFPTEKLKRRRIRGGGAGGVQDKVEGFLSKIWTRICSMSLL